MGGDDDVERSGSSACEILDILEIGKVVSGRVAPIIRRVNTNASDPWPPRSGAIAVLASGGLDSSVLLGELALAGADVTPIFVRVGSVWEPAEFEMLKRFLAELNRANVRPIVELSQPVRDLYGPHWSLTGEGVPMNGEPDEASFLPGRNVLLLAKPLLYCLMHGIPALATAPLGSNPFPDATPAFYDGFAEAVSRSLLGSVRVLRPYADMGLHKADVVRRGRSMPIRWTLSCARPDGLRNCGRCSKCGERKDGFRDAGIVDPTDYSHGTTT